MILIVNELQLVRHDETDSSVQKILDDPGILENLSEARSYPAPMPSNICFRIEKDGEAIGQVCLKAIRWINHKAQISMFIKKDMQSKGFGMKALNAIIDYGFNRLNLYRLEAEVIDGNESSIKMVRKTGFTEEGRLREAKFVNGEFRDLLIFGLLKKDHNK